jgi:hypothetical protein
MYQTRSFKTKFRNLYNLDSNVTERSGFDSRKEPWSSSPLRLHRILGRPILLWNIYRRYFHRNKVTGARSEPLTNAELMNAWSLTSTSVTCDVMLRHRDKFRFTLSYGCTRMENNIKMYLKINMGMRFGYICRVKYKTRKLCGSVKNRSG